MASERRQNEAPAIVKDAFNLAFAGTLIFIGLTVVGGLVWLCVEFWTRVL